MVGRIRDPLTGAVLRASGKKDSRNEDRDANPMNDAIPGEVVRRSEKFEKSGPSTKALAETDITAVLSKGSGTREKWLKKALQQVSDGELQAVDIYNILKVPDFAADLKEKTGRSMYKFLMSRISVFSKGQQRFLAKECPLAQQFGGGGAAEPMVDDSKQNPEAAEEMMARVRQFVRQQQGVELDQAVAGIAPVPAVPAPPPAAPAALVPPAVRQDMSAVANIIARASNTAVNYQAAAAVAAPPAPVLVPVAPVAAPVSAPVSAIREEKASSESEVRQREPSSSASRRKSKKTRKNRSRSRDRRRR
ncbi:unnamed protein product [Cladocopium goreaui]|uniref:Aurora kinase n=1 Tax=Cladocopium goreaui TaxID=2562237 RepID=A0A9P1G806_9DINO|nr:unnamed protein product [Cladocopium goreaui]|mmetsp:Transcript_2805/g.5792  ORF Transcript_2805/g.5792 Transcript_2805/m.5792 type:complete len:306 (-) Transcript_2805:20-937(-)